MTTFGDGVYEYGGMPVGDLKKLDIGNVYYCALTTNTLAKRRFGGKQYNSDGSWILHNTIQSALDACTTQRQDYVVLLDNFSITAALTMSKSRVHLVSPQGIRGGHPGDRSITQGTSSADVITISGHGNEVAGIWLNTVQGGDGIDMGSTWVNHIHHNYVAMAAKSSSNNSGITGTAPIQFNIHHNVLTNHLPAAVSGTDNDITAFIGYTSNVSTRGVIADNMLCTGVNTAVATGISAGGYGQFVLRNYLLETPAFGDSQAGTFTLGISSGSGAIIADNRIAISTDTNAVSGATANHLYICNYEGDDGGTLAT